MPFTIAHPAAILPFQRLMSGRLSFSALIIGSMSPDFIYFLPFGMSRLESHSLAGLFWFCCPAGLLAWFLFHFLLKQSGWFLLPGYMRKRLAHLLQPPVFCSGGTWRKVIISLLLGAATHVIWDLFTHPSPVTRSMIPVLGAPFFELFGKTFRGYLFLQHSSSVFGISWLALSAYRYLQRRAPVAREPLYWATFQRNILRILLIAITLVAAMTAGFQYPDIGGGYYKLSTFVRFALIAGINSIFLLLFFTGLGWRIFQWHWLQTEG